MLVFDFIRLMDSNVTPENSKVHLASWNGQEDPLRVYLAGGFEEWQSWQTRKNFERPHVVSLIQLPERSRWLFAGVYAAGNSKWHGNKGAFQYKMSALATCSELTGRLVVDYERQGRMPYRLGENCAAAMTVHAIHAEPMLLDEFPGFKKVDLGFEDLAMVTRQNKMSWRTALSNVAGVYLISDADSGRLYVGSATGEGGIWARWCQYIDGHGNNVELRRVIAELGVQRAKAFRFSILEIADVHASVQEVLERESHWKRVLLARAYGYNRN